ncbi:MAG: prepilin peptidase [Alphaproteobacteria bacterium]|nr:prepilin peptidase [Alphaproteobacteria bacterium]
MFPTTISLMPSLLQGAFWLIVASLLFSCITDLRYRIVCNEVCVIVLLAAGTMALAHGMPDPVGWIAYGSALVFVLALTIGGAMGGGDAKLILALLPSLTAWGCLQFAVVTCVTGGGIGLLVLALSRLLRWHDSRPGHAGATPRRPGGPFARWLRHERARLRRGRTIPYVPAIAIGWLVATNG